jgi:hypothetical protein
MTIGHPSADSAFFELRRSKCAVADLLSAENLGNGAAHAEGQQPWLY